MTIRAVHIGLVAGCLAWGKAPVSFQEQPGQIEVSVAKKLFTVLNYKEQWSKPFLLPLRSVSGEVVTRDFAADLPADAAPGDRNDRPWLRGVWFGHGDINGFDFWREAWPGKTGKIAARGKALAKKNTLSLEADLVTPGPEKIGSVRYDYRFDGDADARWADITVTIHADAGAAIRMEDSEYGAFGVRLADDFREDRGGTLRNSTGLAGATQISGQPAKWIDAMVKRNGKAIGVAIFDHPANPRQPAYWVADGDGLLAANPFGVRSFTKDSKKNGLFLIPKLTRAAFRYRVVVHEGGNVDRLYTTFLREQP